MIQRSWQPQKEHSGEEGYRNDLLQFLRKELGEPDMLGMPRQHSIQKESGRHLADIGIDRRVGVELKLNLTTKAEADRLIGQVRGFLQDYQEGVIVVLCGKTDMDKLDYIKDGLREYSQQTIFGGKIVRIITKTRTPVPARQPASIFDFKLP